MADEPLGMRPREDDGMDAWVAVEPVHQCLQLVGDVEAEHAVRAAVDPDDQDGSAVLDLEVALVFVCHGSSFRGAFVRAHDVLLLLVGVLELVGVVEG
jgi:hypothetical protein